MSYRYENGRRWAMVHVTANVHPTAVIGSPPEHREWWEDEAEPFPAIVEEGCRIGAHCTLDAGFKGPTVLGARSWMMASVHIGHDIVVGEDCEFAPMTSIGGHTIIGDRVRFGQGALTKPFVRIGDDARIGMGAVVICDVPAGEVWAGNPARRLRRDTGDMGPGDLALWLEQFAR